MAHSAIAAVDATPEPGNERVEMRLTHSETKNALVSGRGGYVAFQSHLRPGARCAMSSMNVDTRRFGV